MLEVHLLEAAEEDFLQALAWYEARSTQAAAGFEAAVDVAIEQIAGAPSVGPDATSGIAFTCCAAIHTALSTE